MNRGRIQNGFTLIELLAVVFLVALLAGVTMTHSAKLGTQTVLTNQARQIYLAAKYARIAAIEQQKAYILQLDSTGRQIFVGPMPQEEQVQDTSQKTSLSSILSTSTSSSTEAMTSAEPAVVSNSYTRPIAINDKLLVEQFLVEGESLSQNECIFYPDGTAQACVIQLGDGQRHASVLITQTGRTQVQMAPASQLQTGRVDLDRQE